MKRTLVPIIHRSSSGNYKQNTASVYSLLTDVVFQLLAVTMVLLVLFYQSLSGARAIASKVPGYEDKIRGLEGKLDDAEEDLTNSKREGEEKNGIINTLQQQVGDQGEAIGQLTDQISQLQPGGPLDLVVVIDVTGSQLPVIDQLRTSMVTLFDFTQKYSSRFRVGIVAYRNGVVSKFDLLVIKADSDDQGKSQRAVVSYLNDLEAETSATNHMPALVAAARMFSTNQVEGTKQIILWIGDIGPCELNNPSHLYDSEERAVAQDILNKVKRWASYDSRLVGTLYTGPEREGDHLTENLRWFQKLAQPPKNFHTDTNVMLRAIINMIEPRSGSQT